MVRVFVASNLPTAYPYKLQKPTTVCDSVRDTAETFIMDSAEGRREERQVPEGLTQ